MAIEVLATLLGVALAALVAACGAGFRWLRSDFRDLRSHIDARFAEHSATTDARFDRLEARFDEHSATTDARFDRLEARFDELIMVLARAGTLVDTQLVAAQSSPLTPQSEPIAQSSEPAPAPTEEPAEDPAPTESPSGSADSPRAPPTVRSQRIRRPQPSPDEPFGPTAAPA